jgi:hypothetical protein
MVGEEAIARRPNTSPASTVKKYCQLDFDGSRLSSGTWKRVSSLVSWEDEPGWDTYTVVSGFQISSEKQSQDAATISVVFSVVGTMSGDGPLKEERKKESLEFHLKRVGTDWKILEPMEPPHVSIRTATENTRELMKGLPENSPRRVSLQATLSQMESLKTTGP